MVRRLRSGFELEVFDQRVSSRSSLTEFLALYVTYFTPRHRTDTNQLLHYINNPLPGRRIIYFGLRYEGQAAGFCVLMYYPETAAGIFDFIVIAPTRRGHGAFFEFANLIAEYLERRRILPNYMIAEVVEDEGQLTHGITPRSLIRLLRLLRFRRVKLPYCAPDPAIVTDPKQCKAWLMLAVEPDRPTISASELIRLFELIYLDHYLLWFKGVMAPAEAAAYEQAVRAECATLSHRARVAQVIDLNGIKDLDVALEPRSENRELTFALVGATTTAVTLALAMRDDPWVTGSLVAVAVLALFAAMFQRRIRRLMLTLFRQAE
jgi:hypothetical protein